jgi:signal transduction histidine kinase
MEDYQFKIEQNFVIQKTISSVLRMALEPIPFEEQIDRTLDLILKVPGLALQPVGGIYLAEDEMLVLKASRELPGSMHAFCKKIQFGKCLCGKAAFARAIVFADRIDDRHEIRCPGEFPHGHYCVPLISGGKVLGLINLLVPERHEKTPEEEEFLSSIANTLAGIIERNHVEMDKRRLTEQIAESEKMAALGRLTASVAHEIRNPLTSIGGFTRRLQKRIAEGTKEKEYAGFIISEVTRLENILRNVLAFSRGVMPAKEEFNVHEVIERALRVYEEICVEQSIALNKSFGDVPLLHADRELVLEAVENLVSNAVNAMPEGGTLTVTTGFETVKGTDYLTIEIKDTGRGIAEEDLTRIFEPFFTKKLNAKGAGLGLSITEKIMEAHNGFIRVESKPGAGSKFTLYFPCTPGPENSASPRGDKI